MHCSGRRVRAADKVSKLFSSDSFLANAASSKPKATSCQRCNQRKVTCRVTEKRKRAPESETREGPSKKAKSAETETEEVSEKKEEVAAQAVQELRGLREAVGRLTVAVSFGLGNLTREVSGFRQAWEEERTMGWGERVDQGVGSEVGDGDGAEDGELSQTLPGASEDNGAE
jgi:hypothetical protein